MLKTKPKNRVVAVFAHPDDESLGPGGTLAKFSQSNDVYILCATCGETHGDRNLGKIRSKEMEKSAKILGIKNVTFLNFLDGTLSNNLYHKLAAKIEQKLKILKPQTLITFEPRGVSGHIDHIVVSLVTTFVFFKLSFIKELLYYCLTEDIRKAIPDYFIYFPPGYKKSEIDKVVNVEDVWDKKMKSMKEHKSQMDDVKTVMNLQKQFPKVEHFLAIKK